ncbi:MAG: hypothetical protein M1539_06860 [Actinobacteria bacterium]|nr:hypothetical protein [Actinomycetota bacterium]MCL5883675.1 hypothetical protein [Actinomycetota bacterium]
MGEHQTNRRRKAWLAPTLPAACKSADIITPLVVFGLIIASDRMQKQQKPAMKNEEPWLKRAA